MPKINVQQRYVFKDSNDRDDYYATYPFFKSASTSILVGNTYQQWDTSISDFKDTAYIVNNSGGGGTGTSSFSIINNSGVSIEASSLKFAGTACVLTSDGLGNMILTIPDNVVVHSNKPLLDGLSEVNGKIAYKNSQVSEGDMKKSDYDVNGDGVVDKAATLQGLIAAVSELNQLQGITDNVQSLINKLMNIGNFSGSVQNYANIATTFTSPKDKDMAIVIADEQTDNTTSIYLYSVAVGNWQFAGKMSAPIRDFSTKPLNINTETTGILDQSKIDPKIARKTDVQTFSNAGVLSNLSDDGAGGLLYRGNAVGNGTLGGGSSVPTLKEMEVTVPLTSYQQAYIGLNTTFNKYDLRTLYAKNTTNSENIQIDIYDASADGKLIYSSNQSSTIYDIINVPCEDKDASQQVHVFVTNKSSGSITVDLDVKITNLL